MKRGPCARVAIDAKLLVEFIGEYTEHQRGGHPIRLRRLINGVPVTATDARVLRRWATAVDDATVAAARKLLKHYKLTLRDFADYAVYRELSPTTHGDLNI